MLGPLVTGRAGVIRSFSRVIACGPSGKPVSTSAVDTARYESGGGKSTAKYFHRRGVAANYRTAVPQQPRRIDGGKR